MPTREQVFKAIDSERAYQHARWQGHEHPVGTYLTYMSDYLAEAVHVDSQSNAKEGKALESIRKFAALGVACMEENGFVDQDDDVLTPGPCDREQIYQVINAERAYQNTRWPVEHDVSEELTLMRHYIRRADETWAVNIGDRECLCQVRKVVTIAVRCMEVHGAPLRTSLCASQVL